MAKRPPTKIVAKAVLTDSSGKVLLLRRSKTDTRRPLQWDLPGGMVEPDEDMTVAASRELAEEAGIHLSPQELALTCTETAMTEQGNVCWLFFVGRTANTDVRLSFEHDKHVWLEVEQAIDATEYERQRAVLVYLRDNSLFA